METLNTQTLNRTSVRLCEECDGEGCRAYISHRGWRCEGNECGACRGRGTLCAECGTPCREDEACETCAERAAEAAADADDLVTFTADDQAQLAQVAADRRQLEAMRAITCRGSELV